MKGTLIAFSVTIMLAVALFLAIGLSGCNWFDRNFLGKPDRTEEEERNKQRSEEMRRLDSMRSAETIKLAELQARESSGNYSKNNIDTEKPKFDVASMSLAENNRSGKAVYHIIVGSYEERINVEKQYNNFKMRGYHPTLVNIRGLTAVSAVSYEDKNEAEAVMKKMKETNICPKDAWIYKIN